MTNREGLESTWQEVAGRYRPQHLRNLRSSILRILHKPDLSQRFGSVRAPRVSPGPHCDVCSNLCSSSLCTAVCGLCEAAVHRSCYRGVLVLKEMWDEWLCDRCFICGLNGIDPKEVTCALCLRSDGALKYTSPIGWVHPTCVLLSPQVEFTDQVFTSIREKAGSGPIHRCCFCGKDNVWTIPCSQPLCELHFHVKCLQRASKYISTQQEHLRCIKHNTNLYPSPRCGTPGTPRKQEMKTTFIDLGDELEVYIEPRQSMPPSKRRRCTVHSVLEAVPKPRRAGDVQRQFYTDLQKETNITEAGTCGELLSKLKAFLRANQQKTDFNYYDISHMPRLAQMIGSEGKVEHSSLETIVLAHSFALG